MKMSLGVAMMHGRKGGGNKASFMQAKSSANMKRTLLKKRPIMRKRAK